MTGALIGLGVGAALWIGGYYMGRGDKKMGGMWCIPGFFITIISAVVFLFFLHWAIGIAGIVGLAILGVCLFASM